MEGDQLRQAEHRLLSLANRARSKVSSHHAQRHIKDGFMHRLLMSQEARLELEAILEGQGDSGLDTTHSVRLSLYLGAFYMNMIGALDNLAWALNYELELNDDVDEEGQGRTSVGLFHSRFLAKLEDEHSEFAAKLSDFKPWFQEVKSLRDPAAHRIPPGFVTGYITDKDIPEFKRLMAEAERSFAAANEARKSSDSEVDYDAIMARTQRILDLVRRGYELRHEAESLSKFSPLIIKFNPDGNEIAWAPSIISRDQTRFIDVSSLALTTLTHHQNT